MHLQNIIPKNGPALEEVERYIQEYEMVNGLKHGVAKHFNQDGKLTMEINFKNDKKNGLQIQFQDQKDEYNNLRKMLIDKGQELDVIEEKLANFKFEETIIETEYCEDIMERRTFFKKDHKT